MKIDIAKLEQAGFAVKMDGKRQEINIYPNVPTRMEPGIETIVDNLGLSSEYWKDYVLDGIVTSINNAIIFDIMTKENK